MKDKIILGTVQFGLDYGINNTAGIIQEDEVFNILDLAYDSGILLLDTASSYGIAEERIGKYLLNNKDKQFGIVTKFNLKQRLSPVESLEGSLQRLNLDVIDTFMFHCFEDFQSMDHGQLTGLLNLKGVKYRKLGISLYTNSQLTEIAEKNIFDVVQIPFNLFDNESQRGECLRFVKSKNLEIHTRSVFLQGLFFIDQAKLPAALNPLKKYLNQIESIARLFSVDIAALAMQYVFSKSYINNIIIGVDSANHFKKNIENLNTLLPEEAINAVDEIIVDETSLLNPSTWQL